MKEATVDAGVVFVVASVAEFGAFFAHKVGVIIKHIEMTFEMGCVPNFGVY